MQPDEKRMLIKALTLAEENNRMLKKMRRAQTWGTIVRLIYWGIIFGGAALAWYYLKPVYEEVWSAYTNVADSIGGLQETGSSLRERLPSIDDALEQLSN